MSTKKPRCMITVDDELFQEIEDFRFERRFQNRSEAALYILRLGFEKIKEDEAKEEKK